MISSTSRCVCTWRPVMKNKLQPNKNQCKAATIKLMSFSFASDGFLNTSIHLTSIFLFEVATIERNSPLVSLHVFDGFFFIALKNLVLIWFSFEHALRSFSATTKMHDTPECCSYMRVVLPTVNNCGGSSKFLSLLLDWSEWKQSKIMKKQVKSDECQGSFFQGV